jgi:hypothetical protein
MLPCLLLSQQYKTDLSGVIINDATREGIPGANILLIGSTFGASTDTSGNFHISNFPPGIYEVRVSAVGFSPTVVRGVAVSNSKAVSLSIPLVERLVQMSEVVTVGGQWKNLTELNVSTRFLDYREIQHTAGAFDDVLRTITILPGVAQTRIDRNDLSVRGGSSAENLQLIDGFEIDNINHFGTQGSGGGTNTFLNLDFVENSFFSVGGFGVRFGDRLSSVLSVDMRDGRRDRFRGKATLSATQVGLNLDGPLSESASFLFSARRSYLDAIFKLYGFSYTPYFWDFLGKLTYTLSPSDKLEVLGIGVIDRMRRFDDTEQERLDNNKKIFLNQTKAIAGISWQHRWNYGIFTLSGRHSNTDFQYYSEGGNELTAKFPHLENNSIERETLGKADAVIELFKDTELSAGLGAESAMLSSRFLTTVYGTGFTKDTVFFPVDLSAELSGYKYSWYAQISQTLGPVVVTGGIRGDRLSMIHQNWVISPRFSTSIHVLPATTINASIGRYNQSPSYIWLIANPYNRALTNIGMNQYVLGVEHYLKEDLSINLEGYIKKYDHYPVSLTRPYVVMVNTGAEVDQFGDAYTSLGLDYLESSGTGISQGVELFVQKKVSETPLYYRMSVTYSKTEFVALDGISRPSNFDQRWKVSITAGYAFDEKWEFNTSFRLATGRPYTPYKPTGFARSRDDYNTARVGTNHALDARVNRRWIWGSVIINTFIDIQNLYNKKPEEPPEWDLAAGKPKVTETIGIVPTIGIAVEF